MTHVGATSSRLLLALGTLAGLAGCPSEPAKTDKPAAAKAALAESDKATADKAVADKAAADKTAVAAAPKADADGHGDGHGEEGCIYVDGNKGKDGLECPAPALGSPSEPDAPPNGEGHYGAKFALADSVPLTKALGAAKDAPVLVSGEVEAVCQKKGCWMVIKDGTESARVLMKDHAFAVPMDCRGKKVRIEGTLASRTFTEKQVKHLAKDGGGNPDAVSGERTEHVLTATGILIQS